MKKGGAQMDIRAQRIFTWCGPVSFGMALAGTMISGFIPPPSPAASAEDIAAIYRTNGVSIAIGGIIFMLSTPPFVLFIAVLSAQIRRIEGDRRTFTYAQLVAGTVSMVPVLLIPVIWCATAFQ